MALDFPPNPSPGDQYLGYIWDGTKWTVAAGVGGTAGVSSYNTRTGPVTSQLADVTSVTGTGSTAQSNLGLAAVAATGAYSSLTGTPAIPAASSTTPVMDGTAAVGSGTTWARGDHVHPSDTSRLATAGGSLSGALTITDPSTAGNPSLTITNTAQAGGCILKLTGIGSPASKHYRVLNGNWQVIDSAYANVLFSLDDTGGGTFSGPSPGIVVNGAAGTKRSLTIQSAGKNRWSFTVDSTAESGSNAGSNLAIQSWDDAGATNPATAFFAGRDGTVILNNVFVTGLFASAGLTVASSGPTIRAGTGAATGTQPAGSLWLRTDGSAGARVYVSAGGGTWAAIAGV